MLKKLLGVSEIVNEIAYIPSQLLGYFRYLQGVDLVRPVAKETCSSLREDNCVLGVHA